MTFGSLFSGIGGMDLGLERAGMECRWQVEIDEFCRKVLTKHWPKVPKYGDITKLTGTELERVDLIAGGFPCQDLSLAGKHAGIDGERSSLWWEFERIIGLLQPRFVIVENVSELLNRGMGDVLGALAERGYDAEWSVIRSCELQAPHMRPRLFIVAYSPQERRGRRRLVWTPEASLEISRCDTQSVRPWAIEPRIPRVAYGVSNRVDRVRSIGNAVVPQVAEWIGRRIMDAFAPETHVAEEQDAGERLNPGSGE